MVIVFPLNFRPLFVCLVCLVASAQFFLNGLSRRWRVSHGKRQHFIHQISATGFLLSLFRCGPWLKSVQSCCGPPLRPQRPPHAALTGVGFSESKRFHLHLPGSASSPPSAILYQGNFKKKSSWLNTDMHEDLVFVDSWNCVFDQFVTLDLGLF